MHNAVVDPAPVLTYLEMSDRAQFRPARREAGVVLRPLLARSREIRTLTLAAGRQFRWPSQSWSEERWETYLADTTFIHWAADLHGVAIGILSINTGALPDVEIDSFGLLPEHHGRGLGSEFLTCAVGHLWDQRTAGVAAHLQPRPSERPPELPRPGIPGPRACTCLRPADKAPFGALRCSCH
jgi:GNAT superfamily N-acetyltransferase